MRLKGWYVALLAAWVVFGLPGLVLGVLWAGGDWRNMVPTSEDHPVDILVWLVSMAWMLSPLYLAPLGMVRTRPKR